MSDVLLGRCGNCMGPHRSHRQRMEAPPTCPTGGGVYREATEEELDAGYKAAFPEGPQPIATFKLDDPDVKEKFQEFLRGVIPAPITEDDLPY